MILKSLEAANCKSKLKFSKEEATHTKGGGFSKLHLFQKSTICRNLRF